MKKIFVLFVMFLFVFSTTAIAEDNETSDDSSGPNQRCRGGCPQFMPPAPDFCKGGTIVSGGVNECGCNLPQKCEFKRNSDETKDGPTDKYYLMRKATQEVKEARLELVKARQEYKNTKELYQTKRQEVSKLKEQYKECKSSETETCRSKVKETKSKVKEQLINAADLILNKLEELKTNIQSSTDLTDERSEE